MKLRLIGSMLLLLSLVACEGKLESPDSTQTAAQQNMTIAEKVALGERVYRTNCAECHGDNAQGDANWRKRDAQGNFPPPPLNGSGHAWHHPATVLKSVILDGSPEGKGNMPAWRSKITDTEIDAVILWFQSLWPQPIYDAWLEMQQRGR